MGKTRELFEPGYKGHEIKVWRDMSLGAGELTYYYFMRLSDGWFIDDGFTYDESLSQVMKDLKKRVEDYIVNPALELHDDWDDPEVLAEHFTEIRKSLILKDWNESLEKKW